MHQLNREKQELVYAFFGEKSCVMHEGKGGMNNTTFFVECEEERFVLRMYGSHQDADIVRYEHHVLDQLARTDFQLQTPIPQKSTAGESIVVLNGEGGEPSKLAACFRYIEGVSVMDRVELSPESLGRAAGLLSQQLSQIAPSLSAIYLPYYQLEESYPLCTRGAMQQLFSTPPPELVSVTRELALIGEWLPEVLDQLPRLERLPHQLIHGDLNASNVLTGPQGEVTAILDFEFVTWDLRVMELAVMLSDALTASLKKPGELQPQLGGLIKGFCSAVQLTSEEIEALPDLLLLRRIDVFFHFISRYWQGIDDIQITVDQTQSLCKVSTWLKEHSNELIAMVQKELAAMGG